MTLIVGVQCVDGVVIGAESAATLAIGPQVYTAQEHTQKLSILGDGRMIFGLSGSVGLSQLYREELKELLADAGYEGKVKTINQAKATISGRFHKHFKAAWESAKLANEADQTRQHSPHHASFIGMVIQNTPYVIGFDSIGNAEDCSDIAFAATGSGQKTADPFLCYVSKLIWPNNALKDVRRAKFAVTWAIRYCIDVMPDGIGGDIHLATIEKDQSGQWRAGMLDRDEVNYNLECVAALKSVIQDSVP